MWKLSVALYCLSFSLLLFSFPVFSSESYNIDKYGRRIQLDGFLLEWSAETSKKWGDSWRWDALRTPEGLAGYLRSEGKLKCTEWKFSFETQKGNTIPVSIPVPPVDSDYYKVDRKTLDSLQTVSIEWVIPWNRMDTTGAGKFTLLVNGVSACGDTLKEIMLTGSEENKTGIITLPVVVQGILIVILAAIYIVIKIRIRNQTARKGSPRR
ncbi:MAG: hypothetical protein GX089_03295 [Fibrobacter sp.]|nr:hypothetical protein [Fibrobacter sp.]